MARHHFSKITSLQDKDGEEKKLPYVQKLFQIMAFPFVLGFKKLINAKNKMSFKFGSFHPCFRVVHNNNPKTHVAILTKPISRVPFLDLGKSRQLPPCF